MDILEIFRAIHSEDHQRILNVLKRAVYIDKLRLPVPTEAYHTGFKFKIHTGSEFELYFATDEQDRIHLIYSFTGFKWFPLIAGLKLTRSERYFDRFHSTIFTGISDCNLEAHVLKYEQQDIINQKLSHSTFKVYRKGDDSFNKESNRISDHAVIEEFPLSKVYEPAFYLGDGELYLSVQDYRATMDLDWDED